MSTACQKDRKTDGWTDRQMMTILRKLYQNDDNVENGEEEYEDVNCEQSESQIFF